MNDKFDLINALRLILDECEFSLFSDEEMIVRIQATIKSYEEQKQ